MYVCFGFWWWARLPLPEKGRWVGRRVRRVNLERALSRSSARVCAQMNAHREVGSGKGGPPQPGWGFWIVAFFVPRPGSIQHPSSSPLSSGAPFHPHRQMQFFFPFFLFLPFFLAFRHLDLQPDGIVATRHVGNPSGHVGIARGRPFIFFVCVCCSELYQKCRGGKKHARVSLQIAWNVVCPHHYCLNVKIWLLFRHASLKSKNLKQSRARFCRYGKRRFFLDFFCTKLKIHRFFGKWSSRSQKPSRTDAGSRLRSSPITPGAGG